MDVEFDLQHLSRENFVVPTDFARSLALPLREELDRLEMLLAGSPMFNPATADQTFRLTGSDFFAEMLMPSLASQIRAHAPGLRVQLVDLVPERYFAALERDEADLALIPDASFPGWLDRRPMFYSSFVAIGRRDHPEIARAGVVQRQSLPIDLFCDLGHVVFSPEGRLRTMGDAALARMGRQRLVVMTLPVFSGVCRVVGESDLIALVPRQYAIKAAPEMGLALYELPVNIEPALIVGVWHKRSTANPAHAWFRDLVASTLLPLNAGELALSP